MKFPTLSSLPSSEALWNSFRSIQRQQALLMFGDFLYAILPLIVLGFITSLLHQSFADFFSLKEWSFATIVITGAAIQRFVRVKAELQEDTSYRLAAGLQSLVLMLILSVLVLCLVILVEKKTISDDKHTYLAPAQAIAFLVGTLMLFVTIAFEDFELRWLEELPPKHAPKIKFLKKVHHCLLVAEENAERAATALETVLQTKPTGAQRRRLREIAAIIDGLEESTKRVRSGLGSAFPNPGDCGPVDKIITTDALPATPVTAKPAS